MKANYTCDTLINIKNANYIFVFNYNTINHISNHHTDNINIDEFGVKPVGVWKQKNTISVINNQ